MLEFDEFLKLEGCCTEDRHNFLAPPKDPSELEDGLEKVSCRADFYQTYEFVHVSIFAKKVEKETAKVVIHPEALELDLEMPSAKQRYRERIELYAGVKPEESSYKVLGTKVEFKLRKADETSWAVLRKGEETGEIIQIGKPRA